MAAPDVFGIQLANDQRHVPHDMDRRDGHRPDEPLAWGPTSGFDRQGSTHVFARDAFEGGMRNYLGVEDADTQERCLFDVEDTPGLELQPAMRTFVSGPTVYALSPSGNLAEHLLTDLR